MKKSFLTPVAPSSSLAPSSAVPPSTVGLVDPNRSPAPALPARPVQRLNRRQRRSRRFWTVALLLAAPLLFPAGVQSIPGLLPAAQAQSGNIAISVDGKNIPVDPSPVLQKGAVLVPLRGVLEKLGAKVNYVAAEQRIDIEQGSKRISLRVGQNTAVVDAQITPVTTPPQSIGGTTYVPLRALAEIFGYRVEWTPATRLVTIDTQYTPADLSTHRAALKAAGPLGIVIDFHDATPAEVDKLLDAAKDSGAGIIKTRFDWDTLEPSKGAAFAWPLYDQVVGGARKRGLVVVGVLGNSAKWASTYSSSNDANEWRNGAPRDSELAAWQNYVKRVVGRYHNDVHAWQIWENPASDRFRSVSRVYRNVVRLGLESARRSDPQAVLYAAEPGGVNLGFLNELNRNGVTQQVAGVLMYPASQYQPGVVNPPETLLRPFGLTGQLVGNDRDRWVGGLSWPVLESDALQANPRLLATTDEEVRQRLTATFTPQAQADYLAKASALALAAGSKKVIWERLRDAGSYENVEPVNPEVGSGLLHRDFTPRPSYDAFKLLARMVKDRPYLGAPQIGPDVVALVFDNGREGDMMVWAPSGKATLTLSPDADPGVPGATFLKTRADGKVLDSSGKEIGPAAGRFELTERPLWITGVAAETAELAKAQKTAQGNKPLEINGTAPAIQGDSVSVTFAETPKEDGLYWQKYADFRGVANRFVTEAGRPGVVAEYSRDIYNPAAGKPFIYLDVDDDFMYFEKGVPVTIAVTVLRTPAASGLLSSPQGGFKIQYDSSTGFKYTPWQIVEEGEGWVTYKYEVPDAAFGNRDGFDIMINTFGSRKDLVFGSVTVTRGTATG